MGLVVTDYFGALNVSETQLKFDWCGPVASATRVQAPLQPGGSVDADDDEVHRPANDDLRAVRAAFFAKTGSRREAATNLERLT